MWGAIRSGTVYFGKLVTVAVVFWTAVFWPVALHAQDHRTGPGQDSCAISYERAAIATYDRLDKCEQGVQHAPFGFFVALTRATCTAEYILDAEAAYAKLVGCVSIGQVLPK